MGRDDLLRMVLNGIRAYCLNGEQVFIMLWRESES